jgi:hypothetical protein
MTQPANRKPWHVQGKRGTGVWTNIPGESFARREQATHRQGVYKALITDAQFRTVRITDPPRGEEV